MGSRFFCIPQKNKMFHCSVKVGKTLKTPMQSVLQVVYYTRYGISGTDMKKQKGKTQ